MNDQPPYRAYLCCGPNCTERGSLRLLGELEREVARQGLAGRVRVFPGGCMKHCESGPTLTVWPGPVYYEAVTPDRLRHIVADHFGRDLPVSAYFWHDPLLPQRERPRPPQVPTPTPNTLPTQRRREQPPRRRQNDGEVDDFKW